MAMGERLA